jgi:predicted amidohydrolase
MTATSNTEQNYQFCKQQIEKAALEEAKMVFFPECFYYFPEKSIEHCNFAKPFKNNPDI